MKNTAIKACIADIEQEREPQAKQAAEALSEAIDIVTSIATSLERIATALESR